MDFDPGIVISASHNPFEDNGIKVFSGKRREVHRALEREVEAMMADAEWAVPGRAVATFDHTAIVDAYIAHSRLACRTRGALRGARSRSTWPMARRRPLRRSSSRELGFDVVLLGDAPDGRNINLDCGSTHPASLARRGA